MRTRRLLAALALAALVGPLAVVAAPVVIVNDTWLDGTRTDPVAPTYSENGTDVDADLNVESSWFNNGAGGMMVATPGHLTTTTTASSASWTTYFTPEAGPVMIDAIGEAIKVTWVFTPSTVNATNSSQGFRLALVDSPSRLAADGTPPTADYTGYAMFMNMGETLGHSNSFQLMERAAGAGALLSNAANWAGLSNGATNGAPGYSNGVQYTFEMTILHNATNGLDISASMTGGTLNGGGQAFVNFTDSTPNSPTFAFDTFAVRPSSAITTAGSFDTTLFKVEFIPPASFLPGDFDLDLDVDLTDYLTLSTHLFTDVSALTTEQAYLMGDMTSDLVINASDLRAFRFAHDDANGLGAFVAMLARVPEPSAGGLAILGAGAMLFRRRRGPSP